MQFISFLRRWVFGPQRFLAGLLGFLCLLQVEVLVDTPLSHLFALYLLIVWAGFMVESGLFLTLKKRRTDKKQSFVIALIFLGVFYLNHDADVTMMWVWPVPNDTSLDELLRWFIFPLSFGLLVLEIILPPNPWLKWRIWIRPAQA